MKSSSLFSSVRSLVLAVAVLGVFGPGGVVGSLWASDVSVTAANVAFSENATIVPGTWGETVTAGKVVYLNAGDNKFYVADCTVLAKADVVGIAVNGGSAGQRAAVCTEDANFTPGFTLSMSAPVYVLSTSGGIAPVADLTTGDYPVVLMVAKSTTKAAFRARGHLQTSAVLVAP